MVFTLACMLLLSLQTTRALPLNVSSSDQFTGTRHDTNTVPFFCLVVFLVFLRIVWPVLATIMRHNGVALKLTICLSVRVFKFSPPSLSQGTTQPFANAPNDTAAVFESSATSDSALLPTESALSAVSSAATGDEDPSVELSTLASFHTASQHSLAPSNSSTIQSPPDSWAESAPSIVLSAATGDGSDHQSVDLSTSRATSFYSASEHSLAPSNTSTIHSPSESPSGSWVSDATTFVQQPLVSLRRW